MRFAISSSSFWIKSKSHLVWSRLTVSRLTVFYLLYSFAHAMVQVLFQTQAFMTNSQAATLISSVLVAANATATGFALLAPDELRWCRMDGSGFDCNVIWDRGGAYNVTGVDAVAGSSTNGRLSGAALPTPVTAPSPSSVAVFTPSTTTVPSTNPADASSLNGAASNSNSNNAAPDTNSYVDTSNGSDDEVGDIYKRQPPNEAERHPISYYSSTSNSKVKRVISGSTSPTGVILDGISGAGSFVDLNRTCLLALNWPLERLEDTKREDIAFINFHIWVLGMSIVALLNESLVHMLATLVTHFLVTAWSVFQLLQTRHFQRDFNHIITNGACDGNNLLPSYWRDRGMAEIPSAALNGAALVISAVLTWKLVKKFNWATFKRIGANREVGRVYKLILSFSVFLQLSLYFIIVAMALWIDQLYNGAIGKCASNRTLFSGVYIGILFLLLPWIVLGWKGVRLEKRNFMFLFLVFDLVLVGGWATMFVSQTWRWTFIQWRFFSVINAFALLLASVVGALGVGCARRFGTELSRYLNTKERAQGIGSGSGIGDDGDDDEFISALPPDYKSEIDRYSFDLEKSHSFSSSTVVASEVVAFPSKTVAPFWKVQTTESRERPRVMSGSSSGSGSRISVSSAHSASSIDEKPSAIGGGQQQALYGMRNETRYF